MVFGINGNIYGYSNPRKKLQKKSKEEKKEKDQLNLFEESSIPETNDNNKPNYLPEYRPELTKPQEKNATIEKLIKQISESKQSESLTLTLDMLLHGIEEKIPNQKITDIATILLGATKYNNPFSIQKTIIDGSIILLKKDSNNLIKKKNIIAIINLIDKNNTAIKLLKHEKRPEINLSLISQKYILDNCYQILNFLTKTPLLTKTFIRLMKNCIQNGDPNIKKQATALIFQSITEFHVDFRKNSEELNSLLTVLEEIKYFLNGNFEQINKIEKAIQILSERNNS